jgi:hypothetical protein
VLGLSECLPQNHRIARVIDPGMGHDLRGGQSNGFRRNEPFRERFHVARSGLRESRFNREHHEQRSAADGEASRGNRSSYLHVIIF